jgi:hypothetical protein
VVKCDLQKGHFQISRFFQEFPGNCELLMPGCKVRDGFCKVDKAVKVKKGFVKVGKG